MLAHCKIVDVSVCASQAAARKAQPLWQQLGFQAKINEKKMPEFFGPFFQKCIFGQQKESISSKMPMY